MARKVDWFRDKKKIEANRDSLKLLQGERDELLAEQAGRASVAEAIRVELAKTQTERATYKTLAPMKLDEIPEWGKARREIEHRIEDLQVAGSQARIRVKVIDQEIYDLDRKIGGVNSWLVQAKQRREMVRAAEGYGYRPEDAFSTMPHITEPQ